MSRLATSFVLGYHGCDKSVAEAVVSGNAELNPSQNDYDWLGHGIYFWEADPQRAMEYAAEIVDRGKIVEPAIVGAVIDLRECLDLTNRRDLELVHDAHEEYVCEQQLSGLPLPKNKRVKGDPNGDRLLRYLDCAVINHLHHVLSIVGSVPKIDTVRGMFNEGGPLYEGAGFESKTHTQIAVRNADCIIGYFKPRF